MNSLDLVDGFELIKQETGNHPWVTKFVIDGVPFGGTYPYVDSRVPNFLNWTPKEKLANVLELASCEGGQSYEILKSPYVNRLVGLDGKPWLVNRANRVFEMLGDKRATFLKCNFDSDPFPPVHFDSCFCANVLYHLVHPANFLARLYNVTDYLYIATHYTLKSKNKHDGYTGLLVPEDNNGHAWAGIASTVFWFTLPELLRCLEKCGWLVINMLNWPQWDPPRDPHPEVELLCKRA